MRVLGLAPGSRGSPHCDLPHRVHDLAELKGGPPVCITRVRRVSREGRALAGEGGGPHQGVHSTGAQV